MVVLDLIKITDKDKITYQGLNDKQYDNLLTLESDYSYIGLDFKMDKIGEVQVFNEFNIEDLSNVIGEKLLEITKDKEEIVFKFSNDKNISFIINCDGKILISCEN